MSLRRGIIPLLVLTAILVALRTHATERELQIVYTSNMRGQMQPSTITAADYVVNSARQVTVPRLGDLWDLAGFLQQTPAASPRLLLDAGNSLLGSDLLNRMFAGEPAARLLAALHFDGVLPGEQEWCLGTTALQQLQSKCGWPVLCSNAVGLPQRRERQFGSHRVAIYGWYEPPSCLRMPRERRSFRGVSLSLDRSVLAQMVARESAEVVVLLAAVDDYQALARAVPRVNLIIPGRPWFGADVGHGMTVGSVTVAPWVDGRRRVGTVSMRLGSPPLVTATATTSYGKAHAVLAESLRNLILPYQKQLESKVGTSSREVTEELLSYAPAELKHSVLEAGPSAAAEWICDRMRDHFRTDVAMLNHRAVRNNIDRLVTMKGQVMMLAPFGDEIVTLRMRGDSLAALLRRNALENRRYLQEAGALLTYQPAHPESTLILSVAGRLFNESATYTVAADDYLADGAHGQEPLFTASQITSRSGVCLNHLLLDWYWEHGWVEPSFSWMQRQRIAPRKQSRAEELLDADLPEQALEALGPSHDPASRLLRARIDVALMDWSDALTQLAATCQMEPHNLGAWVLRGWVAYGQGRLEEARTAWTHALDCTTFAEAAQLRIMLGRLPVTEKAAVQQFPKLQP